MSIARDTAGVFYAKCKIIDLEYMLLGSIHDSRIMNESGLKRMFEIGAVPADYHLLGDNGYGSRGRWRVIIGGLSVL